MQDLLLEKISDVYETLNIYKSLLVYDDDTDWTKLRTGLESRDFPLVTIDDNTNTHGRMYCTSCSAWNVMIHGIDWSTISVILCVGANAEAFVRSQAEVPKYILTLNI